MRIPLKLRVLPVVGEIDTLKVSPGTRLGIEEAELASTLSAHPNTFHGRLEAPLTHLPLAFAHGDVLTVELQCAGSLSWPRLLTRSAGGRILAFMINLFAPALDTRP